MNDLFFTDPVDRFKDVMRAGAQVAVPTGPDSALSPAAIGAVIQQEKAANGTAGDVVAAVTRHVALNSGLTQAAAAAVVAPAITATASADPGTTAAAVGKALTAAGGVSGQVSLSDPAMLGPLPRLIASALLGVVAILTVVYEFHLPANAGWGAYTGLMVTGILSILGLLILVMGYRGVTISGSAAPPA